jgi:hypothetical protein
MFLLKLWTPNLKMLDKNHSFTIRQCCRRLKIMDPNARRSIRSLAVAVGIPSSSVGIIKHEKTRGSWKLN